MSNVVHIVEPVRTPVGRYGGALAGVRPDDMAAHVIRAVVERTSIPADAIADVFMGCANQAGEDNRNIARMAVLLAGLPDTVPGVTVNRLCASSLEAVIQGSRAVRCGDAEVVIAGGVESMSRAPYVLPKNATGAAMFGNLTAYDTALGWRFPNPAMAAMFPLEPMGETAENIAERWGISREAQDAYALQSHQRAVVAQQRSILAQEIIPIEIPGKKGSTLFDSDEGPRADTTLERLAQLKPAFRKGGSVTPGNSSSLNDGAVAMLLASDAAVEQHGLRSMGRIIGNGAVGVDPRIMGIGPVGAIRLACARAGIRVQDLELIELNEAFAVQALACVHELEVSTDIVNVNGGAIALGHPLGMSGGRILGALVREMERRNLRYGAAALCIGVGQGLAVVVER